MVKGYDFLDLPSSTFACGPGQGLDSVRNTLLSATLFERSHRALDISTNGLFKETENHLRTLLNIPADYSVIFFVGGATTAMDSVVWNLAKNTVSGVALGTFSNRWCKELTCRIPKLDLHIIELPKNTFFTKELPNCSSDLILLTPNETSTGVQLPDYYLKEVWKNKNTNSLVAWDATSCAGGRNLPNYYDVMLFGLQKCFGALGGTSVVILSPKAMQRQTEIAKLRNIPYSLDLQEMLKNAKKHQTLNTTCTTSIWMLNEACKWMLKNGGISAMDNLCKAHAKAIENWAYSTNYLRPLIQENDFRSYTSYTLQIIDNTLSASEINEQFAAIGVPNLLDGIKPHPYAPENSLRISCFPFVDTQGIEQYNKLFKLIDFIVKK